MKRYCSVLLASGAVASGGLGCAGSDAPLTGDNGQSVTIAVAPLDGSGIGVACFDVQVATALGTLWEKGDPNLSYLEDDLDTVCSDDHGNGGNGGMRWVGTCDAQANADTDGIKPGTQNTVTIWFDGIYNTGKTAETEGVYDPCGDTGCALDFTCGPGSTGFGFFRSASTPRIMPPCSVHARHMRGKALSAPSSSSSAA